MEEGWDSSWTTYSRLETLGYFSHVPSDFSSQKSGNPDARHTVARHAATEKEVRGSVGSGRVGDKGSGARGRFWDWVAVGSHSVGGVDRQRSFCLSGSGCCFSPIFIGDWCGLWSVYTAHNHRLTLQRRSSPRRFWWTTAVGVPTCPGKTYNFRCGIS